MMKMKVKIRKSTIEADVASNFWTQMVGLSFSKKRNMLFTMPFNDRWSFWMFGVRYPLKMVFIDKEKKVVDVKEAEPLSWNLRTWRTYVPKEPCKYVLETPFKLRIRTGDRLSW